MKTLQKIGRRADVAASVLFLSTWAIVGIGIFSLGSSLGAI